MVGMDRMGGKRTGRAKMEAGKWKHRTSNLERHFENEDEDEDDSPSPIAQIK